MSQPQSKLRVPPARRFIVLAVAGVVLVGGAWAYVHYFRSLPIGEGPAGPAVDRTAYDYVWTERPVVLLGLGDSVTDGYGAPSGYGYFARLAANPPGDPSDVQGLCLRRVLPHLQTRNLAVSGSTSLEHARKQMFLLEPYDAEVFGLVVMTTGGNDIIHDYGRSPPKVGAMYGASLDQARPWIAEFETRLAEMLDHIEACFPGGCAIFLANIYDPTDGVGDVENAGLPRWPDGLAILAAYNDIITRAAGHRAKVHLVDMHGAFLGHGIHCRQFWQEHYRPEDPHYWYCQNLEDPNERGYDAIRRLFLNQIAAAEVLRPAD